MRAIRSTFAALCLLVAAGGPVAASDRPVQIGGTGMGLGIMTELAEAFAAKTGAPRPEVLPSLGSSGGIRAVADGAIHIGLTSRPLKPAERERGLRDTAFVQTPFILVTSHPSPPSIAAGGVADLFRAEDPRWSDGSPVRVILRQENDSDNDLLAEFFPGMKDGLAKARTLPGVPVAINDQVNLEMAAKIEGSLTAVSLMQLASEGGDVRVVPIDGVAPSAEALRQRAYPYFKTLYLVLPEQAPPAAEAFIAFARSPEAAAMIQRSGGVLVE